MKCPTCKHPDAHGWGIHECWCSKCGTNCGDSGHDAPELYEEMLADLNMMLAKITEMQWRLIETAPIDGTVVWVYVAPRDGLPAFQCQCAWHPEAGWCACELREVTHWMPLPEPPK